MSAKQDRTYTRTASDLERKWNFGQTFAEVYNLIDKTQQSAEAAVSELDAKLDPDEIFNRLTNYGTLQGIYRGEDGGVYINASYIKSGYLSADCIEASSITGTKIASDTITSEQIAANAITTNEIKTGAITTTKIATGAITADLISSYSITTEKLSTTDLIVSAAYVQGELSAATIKADKITGGSLDFSKVTAKNLTIDEAASLRGATIYLKDDSGSTYGTLCTRANTAGNKALEVDGTNGLRLISGNNVYICSGDAAATITMQADGTVTCSGNWDFSGATVTGI